MWDYSNGGGGGGLGGFDNSTADVIQHQQQHHYGGGGNPHSTISFQSNKFPIGAPGMMMMMPANTKAPLLSTGGGGGSSSSSSSALPLSSVPGLDPDVELAVEWSPEEQAILEDGLNRYSDEANILKYIKISATLPEKTVRDVALRCRWMTKKENGKRRKSEEFYTGKKMKDRKEKQELSTPPPSAAPLNISRYNNPVMMRQIDGEGVGGATRHLLDENAQVFSHITANLATYKIEENINLFCRSRNNIMSIMNDMRAMPGIMSQMPPLPASINEELANMILPPNTTAQAMIYSSPATNMYGKQQQRRC